jgi:hypothetical protein
MGLFGSDSKKTTTSTTRTENIDARIGVEGGFSGALAGPGAAVGGAGGVTTAVGDYSTVNLTGAKFKTGMSGAEVKELLTKQAEIGSELSQQQASASAKLAELAIGTVGASRGLEPGDWQRYIPLGIVAVVLVFAVRRAR